MITRIIAVGDISVNQANLDLSRTDTTSFENAVVVSNLEGPILPMPSAKANEVGLENSLDVLNVLKHFRVKAVSLANNHINDFCEPAQNTVAILQQEGIMAFGAGSSLTEAARPCTMKLGDMTAMFFGFGWPVIGCRPATNKPTEGVNPLIPTHIINTLKQLRKVDQASFVACIMHWNYELELYPQPAHRQLAQALVKAGADAVIGLHGHVAQGAELFQGKPIVYGLGNWFMPARKLGHIYLQFPAIAHRELAVELTVDGREIKSVNFHWYRFDSEQNSLSLEQLETWGGGLLRQLTPYAGMDHAEYIAWFRRHRIRRRGLPVYVDYHQTRRNHVKDIYVGWRQSFIRLLVRCRLKGGPRL